jgi:hypothetical protein
VITLVPIVLAQIALLAGGPASVNHGGATSVRGVLANEVAAQNTGHWRVFYQQFDPVTTRGDCSYEAFFRSWHGDAVAAEITRRKGHLLRYVNVHIWTDDVTGSYAFASYDMHIGARLIGHVRIGEDSFVRRDGRWYDRFENADYARDCLH